MRADAPASLALAIARELTPALTTLRIRLEAMLDEIQGGEPQADLAGDLETLHRRVEQMTVIVKALNALGGESGFEPQPIDLNGVVEDLQRFITSGLTGRVVVRFKLDRDIQPVLADTECLRYALTSLIERIAEKAPTVDIATRRETNSTVRIDVGASQKPATVRELTLQADPLRLVLAQSIVRSLTRHREQVWVAGGRYSQRYTRPGLLTVAAGSRFCRPRGIFWDPFRGGWDPPGVRLMPGPTEHDSQRPSIHPPRATADTGVRCHFVAIR